MFQTHEVDGTLYLEGSDTEHPAVYAVEARWYRGRIESLGRVRLARWEFGGRSQVRSTAQALIGAEALVRQEWRVRETCSETAEREAAADAREDA